MTDQITPEVQSIIDAEEAKREAYRLSFQKKAPQQTAPPVQQQTPPAEVKPSEPPKQAEEPAKIDENHPDVKRAHELLHGGEPSQRKALAWFEQNIGTPEKAAELIKQHGLTFRDIPRAIATAQSLAGRGQPLSVESILIDMRQSGAKVANVSGDPLPTSDAAALVELELREYDLQDQHGVDVMKAWLETFQKDNPVEVERLQQLSPVQQKAQLIALFEHAMLRRPR